MIIPRWGIKEGDNYMSEYSGKDIHRAYQVSILDYLHSRGYTSKHIGNGYEYKFEDIGGGFFVNSQKNCFSWFANNGGGGSIECLMQVFGMDEDTAIRELIGEPSQTKYVPKYKTVENVPVEKEKHQFIMPDKSDNNKKMYAYLINQRQLSPDTIREFADKGILFQGVAYFGEKKVDSPKNENIIFLHINENGEPCGADVQGTYSEKKFKGIVPPDESDRGFVYNKGDPGKADTVYLFEAPIDLMSFVELHPEIQDAKFVSMGGVKPTIAQHYMNSGMNIVSCVDNDSAGRKFNDRILKDKMQESLSGAGGCELNAKSYKDRDPPIEYILANLNGKECSFFLSREDYNDAKTAAVDIAQSTFIWANRSNFQVNHECKAAGVKDFNDLLKLKKSNDFSLQVSKIAAWSDKAQAKANERETNRTANKGR